MDALRVLIVDDEEELVSALVERLELRGFTTEGVTTGDEALQRLGGDRYDVVLLDVKMPGLGGLELLQRIREKPEAPRVVLLTGHSAAGDAERGMALGACDYLMKPVKIDDLTRVLRRCASGGGAADRGGHA